MIDVAMIEILLDGDHFEVSKNLKNLILHVLLAKVLSTCPIIKNLLGKRFR
jgi:hypothetical protein